MALPRPVKKNTTNPVKSRDHAVDNLKGILIILVILGHSNLLTSFKTPTGDFLQGYIYLFHMPLFFGLSSLFIKPFSWQFIWKRFLQLMVPFYFFVIIDPIHLIFQLVHPGFSATPLMFNLNEKNVVKEVFVGSAFYLQNALWFLPALFIANLLLSLLIKYQSNKVIIISYVLIFFAVLLFSTAIQTKNYIIPYGVDIAVYIMPLILLIRYVWFTKTKWLTYNPMLFAFGAIIISILIIYIIPTKDPASLTGRFDLARFTVPGTLWGYLLICLLCVFIFLLFLNFNKASIFSWIGIYTLPIFIFHTYPWFGYFQNLPQGIYLLINVLGNIIIGIGLSKLLMKLSPKFSLVGMVA